MAQGSGYIHDEAAKRQRLLALALKTSAVHQTTAERATDPAMAWPTCGYAFLLRAASPFLPSQITVAPG